MTGRPRVYKAEGIILRRRNLGEADSIFTLYSDTEGKFEAVARGVRKARSRMRGHLEPLSRTRVLLAQGRSLDVFTQAETVVPYRAIREDLDRSASALYCAELVDRFTAERQPTQGLFSLIVELLDGFEAGGPLSLVRYFELHLLSLMGYELQAELCAVCGQRLEAEDALCSASAGGLVCYGCRPAAGSGRMISLRAIKVLRFALRADAAGFAGIRLDAQLQRELQLVLGDVIRHVLEAEPRSGRFVQDVANLSLPQSFPQGPV
jgi:DNA repair protein RecO (recombination protein O)